MNHSTRVIASVALVVLAAACGGSPSAARPGGTSNAGASAGPQLVAFSQCVRSHGVPNFPDPEPGASNEKFPTARQLRVSDSRLSAATSACQHLLPAGVGDRFSPAEVPLLLPGMRVFSQCMRSHGVPDWPDPAVDSEGRPEFPLSVVPGHERDYWRSARITAVIGECQHVMPTALGGVPVG
jgi:hypothetical protein